jgi:hypothetical protein
MLHTKANRPFSFDATCIQARFVLKRYPKIFVKVLFFEIQKLFEGLLEKVLPLDCQQDMAIFPWLLQ